LYIARYPALAVLLLLLLALAPARAQNVVYQGETTQLGVEPQPNDTYKWELYRDSTKNFVTAVPDCPTSDAEFVGGNTGTPVNVLWKEPGIYFFKVTATDKITGCTSNMKVGIVKVLHAIPTVKLEASPAVCVGEKITLTATLTGTAPWEIIYTDGTNSWTVSNILSDTHLITIDPGPSVTTDYWVTSVKDKYGINLVPSDKTTQLINPLPAPSSIYHR
jgi:hypothetical protein